jgi:hypothetical protein
MILTKAARATRLPTTLSLATSVLLLALASGCSPGPSARVLFVGNSYTFSNDLPGMVRELAADGGSDLDIEVRAPGGWWWRDHAASSDTVDLIAEGDFDYVVLQEQSMVTALRDMARRESRPAAVELALAATRSGARVVMFMTWGHRDGSSEVGHSDYSSMQVAIANTYADIGAAVAGEVAPVGMAWWISRSERPDITLYQADGSHPSREGTYLAAAVITATLLDLDPAEFEDPLGLDEGKAKDLLGFAARASTGEVPWGG